MSVRGKVVLSFGIYGALAVLFVVWAYSWTVPAQGKLEDFIKLASLWTALLPGALTAWMSFLVLTSQQSSAAEIERLKTDLAVGLESTKARLTRVGRACEELHAAAVAYYYALAALERGDRDEQAFGEADRTMVKASSYTVALDEQVRSVWMDYWQCARRISESSAKLALGQDRKTLWMREAKALGHKLDELSQALQSRLNGAPTTPRGLTGG